MSSVNLAGQSPVFTKVKENVAWAWGKTVEKIQSAAGSLKLLAVRVWERARDFFGPKLTAAKESLQGCYSRLTGRVQPPRQEEVLVSKSTVDKTPAPAASAPIVAASSAAKQAGMFNFVANWFSGTN